MTINAARLGMLALFAAVCMGCGGAATDGTTQPATAGIDGTGAPTPGTATVAYGTVTAFGSVWVNGVRFDATGATITIDGRIGTEGDLHVGDVVLVRGRLNSDGSGTATHISFDDAVQGPITSINLSEQSLVVLGQTVRVDAYTTFTDAIPQRSLAGLDVLDVVEVSGFRTVDGDIYATRIGLQPFDQREFETTGVISSLDSATKRFNINSLVVDYGSAMIEGFETGAVANGDMVEIKGVSLRNNGELIATIVENASSPPLPARVGDRIEIEGLITGMYDFPVGFTTTGIIVKTNDKTVYEGGAYFAIAVNVRVEVEGTLQADRSILASKVRFVHASPIEIAAHVDSVSPETSSFVALGITTTTDVLTRLADRSAVGAKVFNVSSLAAGDYVEVRGVQSPPDSRDVLASLIERHNPRTETRLKGFVESLDAAATVDRNNPFKRPFTILGVTIWTDSATRYPTPNGGELSELTFFFDLAVGGLLEVRGVEIGDRAILATEIRFIN